MKLGVAFAPVRRRLPKGHFARLRSERVERASADALAVRLEPWTPPTVIRVSARRGST